ncbi:hypothetical protein AHAS_Ahas09G0104200 [Arachis hypogaea]
MRQSQSNFLINPSGNRVSSSATLSNLSPPPRFDESGEGQVHEVHNLDKDSPSNSPKRKKSKNKKKEPSEPHDAPSSTSFDCVLEKEF